MEKEAAARREKKKVVPGTHDREVVVDGVVGCGGFMFMQMQERKRRR